MSPAHLLVSLLMVGAVVWAGRRVPLSGRRKALSIGCRAAAVAALCGALWGPPARRSHDVPRRVVYLLDASASIDGAQRAWMAGRLASLESLRPSRMERAVIAFGADARVIAPFGRSPLADPQAIRRAMDVSGVDRRQTNLEAALLAALGLPQDSTRPLSGGAVQERRTGVVVLSDGRETLGDVSRLAGAARQMGLQIFPSPPPLAEHTRTVWEDLVVPPSVQRGSSVPVQLLVFNGAARAKQALVTIALRQVPVTRRRVTVRPGWQVLTVPAPALQRGTLALDVRLEIPDERLSEERRAYTEVEGPPRILFVTDHLTSSPALAGALKRREIEIAPARPGDLPTEGSRLLDDDAVVLFNVPKSSLSEAQVGALRAYLDRFGGGLVMVGLGGDLAHEITTQAPLDPLLPVAFEPKGLREAKRRVCMVLLIDRSASMYGPRIAATKRGAVALVKQLAPEDLVGVLAFDTKPYVVVEVQPAGQVSSVLVDKLVKLRSSGGTDIYPSLKAAENRLELTGATVKHIILLSDGLTPFNQQAYHELIESLRREGTTISTIGIGSAFINVEYLEFLATSTGGAFYQMRNLDELPQLIVRDTQRSLGRLPFAEGYFRPSKSPTTDWFSETTEWPPLRGYLTASARPGARVDLTVDGGDGEDPLLARWSVGRGRVAAFTSDADTRWSPDWIRWPGFEAAWAQVARWAMRPRLAEELFVRVDERGASPQLVVEGELHDPRAALVSEEEETDPIPLSLVQTGEWRWQASLEQAPSGWYQLSLESHPLQGAQAGGDAAPLFAKRWVRIGAPKLASDERVGRPPHELLLRQLARATGGAYDAPDGAFLPVTTTATTTSLLLAWWLPLAIICLLVDIAVRGPTML